MTHSLSNFINILLECCKATYHIDGFKESGNYIIWNEVDTGHTLSADDVRQEESTLIAVDFFSKEEFPDEVDRIREKFKENEIRYRGPSIQFDKDTGVRHWAYTCEVI